MSGDDKAYFGRRAKEERRKAQAAGDTSAGKAHDLLADLCEQKAEGALPWLQVVRGNSSAKPDAEDNGRNES